jgi:hypothetical protein
LIGIGAGVGLVAAGVASPRHSAICNNLARILGSQLRGKPCRAFLAVAVKRHARQALVDELDTAADRAASRRLLP